MKNSSRENIIVFLTLLFPESIMEMCNVLASFESTNEILYSVTIQMKSLSQYYLMVLIVWQDLKN